MYLSRAVTKTKPRYYELLQSVRKQYEWEKWVFYWLDAITQTSNVTLDIVNNIDQLMARYKKRMKSELPKIYSHELLNNLFRHPYTRIDYVEADLNITRLTATKYLKKLATHGFVEEVKKGRNNYYINRDLVNLFIQISGSNRLYR